MHPSVSLLSHNSTDTSLLSKATDYFSCIRDVKQKITKGAVLKQIYITYYFFLPKTFIHKRYTSILTKKKLTFCGRCSFKNCYAGF